jgi:hypothetical protein
MCSLTTAKTTSCVIPVTPLRGEHRVERRERQPRRHGQPIELFWRSRQITPSGVMHGWCAERPSTARSFVADACFGINTSSAHVASRSRV